MTISEHLQENIKASVKKRDAAVVDLVCRGEAKTPVVELFIDNEQGVTLDLCREISRDLQPLFDKELPGARYRLVVSSPGLERPLRHPWQYKKHLGRTLDLTLTAEGAATLSCRLLAVSDQGITVEPAAGGDQKILSFDKIATATVKPPW